jgi:FkbM family methyltransferase
MGLGTGMNLELQLGTFSATIGILYQKGVRYGTVIDLGCADGTFYLQHFANGLLHGSTCVNVDANTLYEPSLREIQQLLGGHYVIAGVSDHDGEIELQSGSHPYWASSLPSDDPYWSGSHNRPGNAIKVRALTLDTLVRELALKPPFLLKLDLQGGELAALRGGEQMLAETDTVICETACNEFPAVCEFLVGRNLGLFDLTTISRLPDGTLSEFYPVFLNRRLDHLKIKDPFKDVAHTGSLVARMDQRRRALLELNAQLLAQLRAMVPH